MTVLLRLALVIGFFISLVHGAGAQPPQNADGTCKNPPRWRLSQSKLQEMMKERVQTPAPGQKFELDLCNAELEGITLRGVTFRRIDFRGARFKDVHFDNTRFEESDFTGALLYRVTLTQVHFASSSLDKINVHSSVFDGAVFVEAKMRNSGFYETFAGGADFSYADLENSSFVDSNFPGADFAGASLKGATLKNVDFSGADLRAVELANAVLNGVNISKAWFQPKSIPAEGGLGRIEGLVEVRFFEGQESGLTLLRKSLATAGQTGMERQITFALEKHRTNRLLGLIPPPATEDRDEADPVREPAAPADLVGKLSLMAKQAVTSSGDFIEGAFRYLFFDLTTAYGLNYGRPLLIIGALLFVFALVYLRPLLAPHSRGAIFRIYPGSSLEGRARVPERLTGLDFFRALGLAFQFSLLSAFQIGWRELNVGSWLTRLQWEHYTLEATGWVRAVSGFQALLSVYLLAMWALTFFGRPFG